MQAKPDEEQENAQSRKKRGTDTRSCSIKFITSLLINAMARKALVSFMRIKDDRIIFLKKSKREQAADRGQE